MVEEKKKSPARAWLDEYGVEIKRYNDHIRDVDWTDFDSASKAYEGEDSKENPIYIEHQNQFQMSNFIIGRLKYYIDTYENFLDFEYSKRFISYTSDLVYLFLTRCREYINNTNWRDIKNKEEQQKEIEFQIKVSKNQTSVKDAYEKLNLNNEADTSVIKFEDNKKVSIPMSVAIEEQIPNVLIQKQIALDHYNTLTAHDIYDTSTEFFRNMKSKPEYDVTKNYFEQSPDVLQFYEEEYRKIKEGINIAGVHISGWLYFHLNFYKTLIPLSVIHNNPEYGETEVLSNPILRDNELYIADMHEKAKKQNKGLFVFGTRRLAKSVMVSSIYHYNVVTKPNSSGSLIGANKEDLDKLAKEMRSGYYNMHPAFKIPIISGEGFSSGTSVLYGAKQMSGFARVQHSTTYIINVNTSNNKASSLKGAGDVQHYWIHDEAGHNKSLIALWEQAKPAFMSPFGWRCTPVILGTGGNEAISRDAQRMLMNPEAYDILPMDWEYLESFVPESRLITWERKQFGIFAPAQMSFNQGMIKLNSTLADVKKVDDPKLKDIRIQLTDWEHSLNVLKETREKKKDDLILFSQERMNFPLDVDECFLQGNLNPFPTEEAQSHKLRLMRKINDGGIAEHKDIRMLNGALMIDDSKHQLANFPHRGGNIEVPVQIFEMPEIPENPERLLHFDGTYVAGLDFYKHDNSKGDSLGALYVFKRNVNINDPFANCIVASYVGRPQTMDKFCDIAEGILTMYGAVCLQEGADDYFEKVLRKKGTDRIFLGNSKDISMLVNNGKTPASGLGLPPTVSNQKYLLNLVISYCDEDVIMFDEDLNKEVVRKGVCRIQDIHLLDEIINYNNSGNFDRIISFGHALAWARYLDSIHQMPKVRQKTEKKYDPIEFHKKRTEISRSVAVKKIELMRKIKKYH